MNVEAMVQSVRWKVTEPEEANASNERIVSVLNEAQDHVAGYIRELDQKFFVTTADLDTVANQDWIALPSDMYASGFLRLEDRRGLGTTARGITVPLVRLHDIDEIIGYGAANATASPLLGPNPAFLIGVRVYFVTTPTEAVTGAYRLWYEKALSTLVLAGAGAGETTTSEIPREYHPLVVNWVVLNYFAKVEDEYRVWDRIYAEQLSRMRAELSTRQRQQARRVRIPADLAFQGDGYGY